jgi:hypothetical protein
VIKTVFVAEMLLSPIVAAIALILPLAANWGLFGYLPAVVWLAMFVQCLIMFRWRGLWFLVGPPAAVLGIVAVLAAAPPRAKLAPPIVSGAIAPLNAFAVRAASGLGVPWT